LAVLAALAIDGAIAMFSTTRARPTSDRRECADAYT
jgi:hypothetical protein